MGLIILKFRGVAGTIVNSTSVGRDHIISAEITCAENKLETKSTENSAKIGNKYFFIFIQKLGIYQLNR